MPDSVPCEREKAMKLKEVRTQMGLSLAKLSDMSGVPVRTLEDIERRKDCRISTARKICDALDISLDELYPSPQAPKAEE